MACFETRTICDLAARARALDGIARRDAARDARRAVDHARRRPAGRRAARRRRLGRRRDGLTVVEAQDDAIVCVIGRRSTLIAARTARSVAWPRGANAVPRLATPTRGAVPYY